MELSTFRKSRAGSAVGKRSRLRKAYVAASSTAFPNLEPRARQRSDGGLRVRFVNSLVLQPQGSDADHGSN